MLTFNILIAILAGATAIVSSSYQRKEEITKEQRRKNSVLISIGLLTMIFTIGNFLLQQSKERADNTEKAKLHADINNIQNTLNLQSANDRQFQEYLKDSFGIERTKNIPVVNNIRIYNSKSIKSKSEGIPDSLNFVVKLKNDTLFISPKEGAWVRAFIATDISEASKNNNIIQEGMGSATPDVMIIKKKKYIVATDMIFERAVYLQKPLIINLSGNLNQYVIFGDQGNNSKRYFYQNGKVIWIPY